jgi:hypothetical protein
LGASGARSIGRTYSAGFVTTRVSISRFILGSIQRLSCLVKIGNLWYYIVIDQPIEKTIARRVCDSLYFRIPLTYWRKHNLKPGDAFFWIPKEGAVILKRITPEIVAELSDEVEPVEGG